jgi:hypothetical protein
MAGEQQDVSSEAQHYRCMATALNYILSAENRTIESRHPHRGCVRQLDVNRKGCELFYAISGLITQLIDK